MKKKIGIKNCTLGANCKSTCIEKSKECLKEKANERVKLAAARLKSAKISKPETEAKVRLFATKPKQLLKQAKEKGIGVIQYASHSEILRTLGVYGGKTSIQDMKSGKAEHPYIALNRNIKDKAVNDLHDHLKATDPGLYTRLSNMGLRSAGDLKAPPKSEQVKIALRVYLEQNGQSFATGKKVSLNRMSLDHIVPLSKGGTNSASNMVLIESNINYVKSAKETQADFADLLRKKALQVNSPEDLAKFQKAIDSKDPAKITAEQNRLRAANTVARLTFDKAQSQQLKDGKAAKAKTAEVYSGGGYAKFNSVESMKDLNAKQLKAVITAQAAAFSRPRGWYNGTTSGTQSELSGATITKTQVMLANGGSWNDVPQQWKDDFKAKFETNNNKGGQARVIELYGSLPGAPEWMK